MTRLFMARLRIFVVLVLITTVIGILDYLRNGPEPGMDWETGLLRSALGWALGSAIVWWLEIFMVSGAWGAALRQRHFVVIILLKSGFTLLTAIAIAWLMRIVFEGIYTLNFVLTPGFLSVLDNVFIIIIVLQTGLQIVRIVGPRTLVNYVLGKYMRPLREETIFMFLDLANSTKLAEEFGDIGVQRMITRFFFEITEPIVEFGGTVHRYVGDQVVVTWPLRTPRENARAVECAMAIRDFIERRASSYEADFGIVPTFRVGLHGGHVVISQMGDQKQELSYFGDTVNTAARIEHQCKAFDTWLLISGEMLEQMQLPDGYASELKGTVQLRGRAEETALYTVVRNN